MMFCRIFLMFYLFYIIYVNCIQFHHSSKTMEISIKCFGILFYTYCKCSQLSKKSLMKTKRLATERCMQINTTSVKIMSYTDKTNKAYLTGSGFIVNNVFEFSRSNWSVKPLRELEYREAQFTNIAVFYWYCVADVCVQYFKLVHEDVTFTSMVFVNSSIS